MNISNFSEAFGRLPLSQEMFDSFADAQIESIKLYRQSKTLQINLLLRSIVRERELETLKNEVKNAIAGIGEVVIRHHYQYDNLGKFLLLYWKIIKEDIIRESPGCIGFFHDCTAELAQNVLNIGIRCQDAYVLKRKQIDIKIQNIIQERLGADVLVNFMCGGKDKRFADKMAERESRLVQEVMETVTIKEVVAVEKEEATKEPSKILLGKKIQNTPIKIVDSKEEGETVTVKGKVLSVDAREIMKGEKYIVSFDMTDLTDSTTAKFFIKTGVYNQDIRNQLKKGVYVKVQGDVGFDKYAKELAIMAKHVELCDAPPEKSDNAKEKRVELHLHTQMSSMDGITSVTELIKRAALYGHKAVAITDHGVVQAFPDGMEAAKKFGIKAIYGVEAYIADDLGAVVQCAKDQTLLDTYVVFDIETTGLNKEKDKIIEIGAVKVVDGTITDKYSSFINPYEPLSKEIKKLTGIDDDMLQDAPDIKKELSNFLHFCGDAVLTAHNAPFDLGFIRKAAGAMGIEIANSTLDTLELSRFLFPGLSRHKLDIVAKHLDVSLENHHRAIDDAYATAEIFIKCIAFLKEKEVNLLKEINTIAGRVIDVKKLKTYHGIILAKNQVGLKNLYQLISKSHLHYFARRPRIPKSELIKYREGLILGSACDAGELYKAVLDKKPEEYIRELCQFYDYYEIQPLGNTMYLYHNGTVSSVDDLKRINQQIIALGDKYKKPVCATGDVHFMNKEDEVFRRIIMFGEGFTDADNQAPLYFRTTDEMLKEFSYLDDEKAFEVVVTNTNKIADMVEKILPIPEETFPPKIEGAEEELREITTRRAKEIYGDTLPKQVQERLDRELNSIIKNGFSVMYIIAQKLVWKSMEDGYLVGSRGSVGSSFVATMAGITEVNPLSPHYVCPQCKYSDFDSETVIAFAGGCGFDMADQNCPHCGSRLNKDGQDIPFETFLGFDGDKEPDIDLNFSGEYQQKIHTYTEELFGSGNIFKAGTIGTLAEKTAFGFVKKYLDEKNITAHNAEINRLVAGLTGIKRTTGQHPGGLMIVPGDNDIHNFCPVQRPANDVNSHITTTHFDYHSISGRLLKLDLLGHDDPTVIRMLYDLTGVNPQTVPLDDQKTMSLFTGVEALGVTKEDINCETGTLGIPEFGTKFVRQMLLDTKPQTFSELIRISGLSHGTDVWLNNAQELVRQNVAKLKNVISTRDDIMVYLIIQGVEKKTAFSIMEKVRKGKGISKEDEAAMKAAGVPDWYIASCNKIKYMFPKAHAAAYVMMAFRIAYFKVYYPISYYAAYFTVRGDDFDYETMCKGAPVVKDAIRELLAKGNTVTAKEKNKLTVLEIVYEMYARNIQFTPLDLYKSDTVKFLLTEEGILPPLNSVQGLGVNAANSVAAAREEGEFTSIADFRARTKVSKTIIELLKQNDILKGIPETSQLSLF